MGKLQPGVNDLETWCKKNGREELLQEWDYEKNRGLTPRDVTHGSEYKVWWKCDKGHEWQAIINSRARGHNCPYCSGRFTIKGINDLKTVNPNLAKEWNYDKNNGLTPADVLPSSNKIIWWKCSKGHEWQTSVNERTRGRGCPICFGKKVLVGFNDLATTSPELIKEWHPTKNKNLSPTMVTAGSNKKVWWLCPICKNEWLSNINNRNKGHGCPFCKNQKIKTGFNDFATRHPQLAKEWHPTKNGDLTPDNVLCGSAKKVWWLGKCGHEWQSSIDKRVSGRGCPICAKEMHTSFPEQAIYYYVHQVFPDAITRDTKTIDAELDIHIPSARTAIEYDGIYWHTTNVFEKQKNQLCKDNNIKLIRVREKGLVLYDDCVCIERDNCDKKESLNDVIELIFNELNIPKNIAIDVRADENKILESYIANKKKNSLLAISPNLASEWHPIKNGKLKPEMVSFGSKHNVWWLGKCGHEWTDTVSHRIGGRGCPYCSGRKHNKIICVETNEIYNTFKDAAISCGLNSSSHISECCRGKLKTAGGYHWKFYEEKEEEEIQ